MSCLTRRCGYPDQFWVHMFSTRFECIFTSSPLVSSVFLGESEPSQWALAEARYQNRFMARNDTKVHLLHPFRVQFYIFSTDFQCSFTSSPLISSVVLHLLHSFRVQFGVMIHFDKCHATMAEMFEKCLTLPDNFTFLDIACSPGGQQSNTTVSFHSFLVVQYDWKS